MTALITLIGLRSPRALSDGFQEPIRSRGDLVERTRDDSILAFGAVLALSRPARGADYVCAVASFEVDSRSPAIALTSYEFRWKPKVQMSSARRSMPSDVLTTKTSFCCLGTATAGSSLSASRRGQGRKKEIHVLNRRKAQHNFLDFFT